MHITPGGSPRPARTALDLLRCPLCGARLARSGSAFVCPVGHSFDIARQGYVGLLGGGVRAASADTAVMVGAREAFLRGGHYAPLAGALAGWAVSLCRPGAAVLDAGVGTGYYLAAVLEALPGAVGLGLDVSKYAVRRAARVHPRAAAATWDVWEALPVGTDSVDLLVNVFAPRNGREFRRVLRPGGVLLVVTPTSRHMAELRDAFGMLAVDGAKEERLGRTLSAFFRHVETRLREYAVTLTPGEVADLVSMGPTHHHLREGEAAGRAAGLDGPVRVTASFRLSVYRPL
ncbi:methyltransferase domain-containing protein [Streptomyces armeniacus]|uniref:Methyltransferase domain-containing protein n=1 Tax=Streptomyces armeniacus TaxID=83291 RepID=A0A345XWS7_9ACTN|nr:methyltransferase domain-containing protein [Streptomyces armeniacus]AXK36093.1 methyltransferase domain-containing protein [Streptomyces armeniacus]